MSLALESVSSGYGETQVLWDIDLKCDDGSLTVVVGPNGAGKSTTLKVVSGLVEAWKGNILFKGKNITSQPTYKRVESGISLAPEGRRVFPALTTAENLKLGAYTRRARSKAEKTFEFVYSLFPRLKTRAGVRAGRLSGGEQQMLAIGRALMSEPSLLVLDEPSLGLGPKLIGEIFEKVKELKAQGLTVLMVEQNAHQALKIADYAYVMQSGKVVNSGTPKQLMNIEELRKSYFSLT